MVCGIMILPHYARTIRRLMEERGIKNPTQLARASGIPQPVVRRIVRGEAKDPHIKTLQRFADFFNVNVDELRLSTPIVQVGTIDSSGDITITHEDGRQVRPSGVQMEALRRSNARRTRIGNRNAMKNVQIPLLANAGSMGDGEELQDGDLIISELSLGREWVNSHLNITRLQNLRFIHGKGDSMSPTFNDGDVLLVDTGVMTLDVDGVYVLIANRQLFIKRVSRRLDGRLEISSDNPNVTTSEQLNGECDVEVCGRVIWAWNGRRL